MGLLIKLNNANFSHFIENIDGSNLFPLHDNLTTLFFMGENVENCYTDKSDKGNNGTLEGNITVSDSYATFSGASYYSPRIVLPYLLDADDIAVIAVSRSSTIAARPMVANYDGTAVGMLINPNRVGTTLLLDNGSKSFKNLATQSPSGDAFRITVYQLSRTDYKMMNYTSSGLTTVANDALIGERVSNTINTAVVGGGRANLSHNDDVDIAMVAIYNGGITDGYIAEAVDYLHSYYTSKGLPLI